MLRLGIDDCVWDHSTFSKNRDRLLDGDVAAKFLAAVLAQPRVKRLLSNDHFSVDVYCGPVLRQPTALIQAAKGSSAMFASAAESCSALT